MKNKGVSRRWFIGGAATGVVSAGLELSGCSRARRSSVEQETPGTGDLVPGPRANGSEDTADQLRGDELRQPRPPAPGLRPRSQPPRHRPPVPARQQRAGDRRGHRGARQPGLGLHRHQDALRQRSRAQGLLQRSNRAGAGADRGEPLSSSSKPASRGSAPTTSTSSTFTAATAPPWPPTNP